MMTLSMSSGRVRRCQSSGDINRPNFPTGRTHIKNKSSGSEYYSSSTKNTLILSNCLLLSLSVIITITLVLHIPPQLIFASADYQQLLATITAANMYKLNGSSNGAVTSNKDKTDERTLGQSSVPFSPPLALKKPINVPEKLLMGPGPSNISPRVLEAASLPIIGHMHKEFITIMDDIKVGLQYVFQTENPWTLCLSGPGHAGMEAVLVNLLQTGEKLLVGVHGIWGNRASDLATRLGVEVHRLEKELGQSFSYADIEEGLQRIQPKVLFLVHSESSTGVIQNLEGIGDLCRAHNCLLVVDTVASLGGVPFYMDQWKIDAVYTGSQKVIGAPPGICPVSFGPRAVEAIKSRTTPIKSFLLDMNHLANYWNCNDDGKPRGYHHTPPVSLFYALREALAQMATEKLENIWNRHAESTTRFHAGLQSMGLSFFVENPEDRLPTVTTIKIPLGVTDWRIITQYAMDKYLVEIAGGLGETVGKVLRIGVMGYNAYPGKVDRVLQALREGIEYARLHGRL